MNHLNSTNYAVDGWIYELDVVMFYCGINVIFV